MWESFFNSLNASGTVANVGVDSSAMNMLSGGGGGVRSVFDDRVLILQAMKLFVRTDKRIAKELSEYQHFACDDSDKARGGAMPNVETIHPVIRNNPAFIEKVGRKAVTLEHYTILGRVLRVAPNIHDPQFRAFFKDGVHLTKPAVVRLTCNEFSYK